MTELLLLAERVEAAEANSRELMCAAYKAVFPEVSSGAWDAIDAWDAGYDRFCGMLDAGAYESAALTIVPEGWGYSLGSGWVVSAKPDVAFTFYRGHGRGVRIEFRGDAATPALALLAAICRARSMMEGLS